MLKSSLTSKQKKLNISGEQWRAGIEQNARATFNWFLLQLMGDASRDYLWNLFLLFWGCQEEYLLVPIMLVTYCEVGTGQEPLTHMPRTAWQTCLITSNLSTLTWVWKCATTVCAAIINLSFSSTIKINESIRQKAFCVNKLYIVLFKICLLNSKEVNKNINIFHSNR